MPDLDQETQLLNFIFQNNVNANSIFRTWLKCPILQIQRILLTINFINI